MNKRFTEFLYQLTEENETLEKKVKNLEVTLKEMFIQRHQYLDQIRDLKKKLSILRKKSK
jgi:predicted  nucleic acid-binding Zn-ribbon protein